MSRQTAVWRVGALAVVLYAGFLIASAPASLLAWAVEFSSGGVARIEQPRGGFWRGSGAALDLIGRHPQPDRFEEVNWEWRGVRLLDAEAAWQMSIDDPKVRGSAEISVGRHRLLARKLALQLPAAAISRYLPGASPSSLQGEILLQGEHLALQGKDWSGSVALEWRGAAGRLNSLHPLGPYRVLASGSGTRVEFRVETSRGTLLMEGHGTWSAAGISFRGSATPDVAREAGLVQLLGALGYDLPQAGSWTYGTGPAPLNPS